MAITRFTNRNLLKRIRTASLIKRRRNDRSITYSNSSTKSAPMLVFDGAPRYQIPNENELLERARDNTQYLFNKIWELEREKVDEAICAKLPRPNLRLPREKVLPEKKQLTKWEQYAQLKGIRKKKKDRKIFDETAQEWKPRYGYRRGKDETKDWLIEIPDHKDPMVDYFAEREEAKKERVNKNELQRLRNIGRAMKAGRGEDNAAVPLGLSTDLEKKSKTELLSQMDRARRATASVGKFQPMLKDEKVPKKTGKTHKFGANEASVAAERKRHLEILDRLSAKKPKINEALLDKSQQAKEQNKTEAPKRHDKKGRSRHKSAVHRQQHFQNKLKHGKKGGAKMRRGAKRGR
ncbi:Ribosome biogenesis regulatory -like protein [Toxocara canis]|uniref:Ribosome biogenesis regulatory protein n=1 Tax=Toxocara canis TaxID=6265 RepID=A0A0B2VZZ3_TOXCA|nr:Ribosome biogenesis regulatory -like protein [Toxocara canis]